MVENTGDGSLKIEENNFVKTKFDPNLGHSNLFDAYNIFYENFDKNNMFDIQNRRYLGSKYKLSEFICWVVENNCEGINTVADIFAGTGVVANLFNICNKKIIVNDLLYSNYLIYNCFFSEEVVDLKKIQGILNNLNNCNPIEDNYFSENFGDSFFTMQNARKIGYVREEIEQMDQSLSFREKAILLSSLIYATDKVANTCGHYDAYRRKLDATSKLTLLMPNLHNFKQNKGNEIYQMDSNELVKDINPDLVYIDPPYNSRQYGDAYHLLENLSEWKKPDVIGVAKKMKDRKKTKSKYCTVKAPKAFEDLIENIDARYILVSYNNMAQKGSGRSNAKISENEILEILNSKGDVKVFYSDYKAFTTGKSNISNHKELLYLVKI